MRFRRELLPVAKSFYEGELGQLTRPSRGWARGRCPWHESRSGLSFSVNLDSGGFYCFGCQVKGGDIVAYVMLRDKIDFKAACRQLGCWDEQATVTPDQARAHRQERDRERAAAAAKEIEEREARIAARDHLHATQQLYAEAIRDHDWLLMSEFLPLVREAEEVYCKLSNLENPYE